MELNKNVLLFNYCPINYNIIDNFMNDAIWGTCPIAFNDPYDSTLCYSKKNIFNYYRNKINSLNNIPKINIDKVIDNILNSFDINILRNYISIKCFSEKIDNEIMWAHYADNAKGFALSYSSNNLIEMGKKTRYQS